MLILNESDDLTFRDYKISLDASESLGVEIMLATPESKAILKNGRICYCSSSTFLTILNNHESILTDNLVTIVDEFDSYVFEKSFATTKKSYIIQKSSKLIMFSGSNF